MKCAMAEDMPGSVSYAPIRKGQQLDFGIDNNEGQPVKNDIVNSETLYQKAGRRWSRFGTICKFLVVPLLLTVIVICTWSIYNGMNDDGSNGPTEGKAEGGELINSYSKLERACISMIHDGKYQEALEQLIKLDSDNSSPRHLPKIIGGAYNGELKNMEHLMEFMKLLPNCKSKAIANTAMFNELRKKDQLRSPFILVLQEEMKPCLESSLTLKSLNAELQAHINILLELWADKIRGGDYEKIISFAKSSNLTKSGITSHVPDIIKRCYVGPDDFGHLLNFISRLPLSSQSATGFLNILNVMQEKQQLSFGRALQVAHKVKERMSAEGQAKELSVFKNLKNMFPYLVRNLIWNGVCTIQTYNRMEHLYIAGDYFKLPDESRQVFTWIRMGGTWPDPKHKWVFQPAEEDAKTFHIKSYFYSDSPYLCQRSGEIWDEKRNDIQCVPEASGQPADCKWELEAVPITEGGGQWKFGIKTVNNRSGTMQDVYLYAEDDSHNKDITRRRVFTWIPGGEPENAFWILNCD